MGNKKHKQVGVDAVELLLLLMMMMTTTMLSATINLAQNNTPGRVFTHSSIRHRRNHQLHQSTEAIELIL